MPLSHQTLALAQGVGVGLALILGIVGVALAVGAGRRQRALERRLERFMRSAAPANLEELLGRQAASAEQADREIRAIQNRLTHNEELVLRGLNRVGLVRFAAFETGPELSFTVAVLNTNRDGLILTSLYGRDETRVYAKPIHHGTSNVPLADEEERALEEAVRQ